MRDYTTVSTPNSNPNSLKNPNPNSQAPTGLGNWG